MSVRVAIVSHLRRNAKHYEPWWDKENPDNSKGTTWDDYLTKFNKNIAWAGALEIAACAAHYGRPVQVLGPHMVHADIYNMKGKGETIFLWYEHEHYEWLRGKPPVEIISEEVATDLCKDGGGSDNESVLTEATRLSALPALPPASVSAAGTRSSALPPRIFSYATSHLLPVPEQPEELQPGSSTGRVVPPAAPRRTKRMTESKCPYCEVSIMDKQI